MQRAGQPCGVSCTRAPIPVLRTLPFAYLLWPVCVPSVILWIIEHCEHSDFSLSWVSFRDWLLCELRSPDAMMLRSPLLSFVTQMLSHIWFYSNRFKSLRKHRSICSIKMKLNTLKMKINMTVQIIPAYHSISREAMQVIRTEWRVSWVDITS